MKRHDNIFIFLTVAAVASIAWVISDNIATSLGQATMTTESVRQSFINMKLPLHEGKYWKVSDE